jgi:hypothetical protein
VQPQLSSNGIINFQLNAAFVNIKFISFTYLIYLQTTTNINLYNLILGTFAAADQSVSPYNSPINGKMMIMGISSLQYPLNLVGSMSLQIATSQQLNQFAYVTKIVGGSEY